MNRLHHGPSGGMRRFSVALVSLVVVVTIALSAAVSAISPKAACIAACKEEERFDVSRESTMHHAPTPVVFGTAKR